MATLLHPYGHARTPGWMVRVRWCLPPGIPGVPWGHAMGGGRSNVVRGLLGWHLVQVRRLWPGAWDHAGWGCAPVVVPMRTPGSWARKAFTALLVSPCRGNVLTTERKRSG